MGNKKKKSKGKLFKNHKRLRYIWIRIRLAVKVVFAMTLMCILAAGIFFYKKYGKEVLEMQEQAKQLVADSDQSTFMKKSTSIVYDCNGKVLPVFTTGTDSGYVKYEDIPKAAVSAMVATEDRDFYEHKGVDILANVKAVYELIKNKGEVKRGGSTITQQLARNIFLSHDVTWQRKTEEIFIAKELEDKYDKYEIMEFYLNNIYFANGYYGIEAASKGYFGCPVTKLNTSQIAFLCAIPNSPTRYDPVVNMNNTLSRRDRILEQMKEQGYIDEDEYETAINTTIKLNMKKKKNTDVSNYVVTYVSYCATRAIMKESGFEFRNDFEDDKDKEEYEDSYNEMYTKCQQMIYSGGYSIYTSIDPKIQKKLQSAVDNGLVSFSEKSDDGIYKMQGAAACVDNKTGRVCAIVGGRSQEMSGHGLNRAYQSYRQPGSSIKPILVYAAAFENGYTPDSIVVDEPIKDGPKNSSGGYAGKVTLRTAVEKSINTVAWRMYEELIPHNCLKHLVNMNFYNITYADDYLPAALGGVTYGATPVEMASAYAALENDGVFVTPTCIVKIKDAYGETYVSNKPEKKVVYEENAARMMTDVLEGVLTKGTAAGYGIPDMDCAGKTGTTNDKKDGWFVGYTPYYTTAVWVGCDIPKKVDNLKGNTYPLYIWNEFMCDIHNGLDMKEFELYETVTQDDSEKTWTSQKGDSNKSDKDNKDDDSADNEDEAADTDDADGNDGEDVVEGEDGENKDTDNNEDNNEDSNESDKNSESDDKGDNKGNKDDTESDDDSVENGKDTDDNNDVTLPPASEEGADKTKAPVSTKAPNTEAPAQTKEPTEQPPIVTPPPKEDSPTPEPVKTPEPETEMD